MGGNLYLSGIQRDEQTDISMNTNGIGISVTFGTRTKSER
jgi:hypothetical protein